jgi:hypothetical protein
MGTDELEKSDWMHNRRELIFAQGLTLACERLADLHKCAPAQRAQVVSGFQNDFLRPVADSSRPVADVMFDAFWRCCHGIAHHQGDSRRQNEIAVAILKQADEIYRQEVTG